MAALRELSPEHRAVVALRFLFDYTPGEIARALDMPRGTVNSRLRRALDRLGERAGGGGVSPATEDRLRSRLREQPLPGEGEAAARSWPVVEAALAERGPGRAAATAVLRLALVAALLCVGLVAALTPAGAEVGDWIGDRFADRDDSVGARVRRPARRQVGARDLNASGAYAIHADGSWRRLGGFTDAGWSPRGWHVVGADGHRLVAVTPRASQKWSAGASAPRSSPGVEHGATALSWHTWRADSLRAVAGDGEPGTERLLRRRAASVTPAWRPRAAGHVLVYATARGGLEALDADSGLTLWRRSGPRSRELAWSRNGRRLAVLSAHSVTVLDARGRMLRTVAVPGPARQLALHPSGRRAAVVVGGAGGTRVLDVPLSGTDRPRQLFQGDVAGLAWSRDGRRLLLAWRDADQWLVLGRDGRVRRALHGVSAELGSAGGFPRVAGWCCPG